jgi:hypothetical protein
LSYSERQEIAESRSKEEEKFNASKAIYCALVIPEQVG